LLVNNAYDNMATVKLCGTHSKSFGRQWPKYQNFM